MSRTLVVVVAIVVLALVGLTVMRSRTRGTTMSGPPEAPREAKAPVWEQAHVKEDPRFTSGVKLAMAGKFEEAEKEFREVLKADPRNTAAYLQIASIYMEQDRLEEALDEIAKVLEIKPDFPGPVYDRAAIYLALDRKEEALKETEYLATLRPDAAEPHFLRCWALEDTDPKAALAECEEYVRLAWLGQQQVPTARPDRRDIERNFIFEVATKALGDKRAAAAYLGERYLDLAAGDQFREMPLYYLQKYVDLTSSAGDPDKARFDKTYRIYTDVRTQARRAVNEIPSLLALDEDERQRIINERASAGKKPADASSTTPPPPPPPPPPQ